MEFSIRVSAFFVRFFKNIFLAEDNINVLTQIGEKFSFYKIYHYVLFQLLCLQETTKLGRKYCHNYHKHH